MSRIAFEVGRGRAGTRSVLGTLIVASIAAALFAGCAHKPGASAWDERTGAVPRDAWGNPIMASAETSTSTNFAQ